MDGVHHVAHAAGLVARVHGQLRQAHVHGMHARLHVRQVAQGRTAGHIALVGKGLRGHVGIIADSWNTARLKASVQ